MRSATVGIDIGTSAVKIAVLGLDGHVLAEASRPYPTHSPHPGWVEQTPEDWWLAACEALREVVAAGDFNLVGAGLSGQLNGVILLDQDNKALGDAIIWLDTRAAAEAEELKRRFADILEKRAATDLSAIAVLAKLAWLARHDAGRLARTRRVLLVKDYMLWRLTGTIATDPVDAASTGMMDIKTLEWIPELCAGAGFDPEILPPIVPSMVVAGSLTESAAAATGLPVGLPVVPGGGDVAALAVGCGVLELGILGVTLGTAGHVVLAVDATAPFESSAGFWRVAHADPTRAIWLGLVMSGAQPRMAAQDTASRRSGSCIRGDDGALQWCSGWSPRRELRAISGRLGDAAWRTAGARCLRRAFVVIRCRRDGTGGHGGSCVQRPPVHRAVRGARCYYH